MGGNRQSLIQFDYKQCPAPTSDFSIDPNKDYPAEYKEFMNFNCYFDLYGHQGIAFEDFTMITEQEVKDILDRRHHVKLEKKKQVLKLLEDNLAKEMVQWDKMWKLAEDEINTFDIHSKTGYGSQLKSQMQDQLAYDFTSLERLVGDRLSEDDLMFIAKHNPNLFLSLLKKLFNFLVYVARLPVDWNNTMETMSNFNQVMD